MKDIQIIPINERKQIEFDWIRGSLSSKNECKIDSQGHQQGIRTEFEWKGKKLHEKIL